MRIDCGDGIGVLTGNDRPHPESPPALPGRHRSAGFHPNAATVQYCTSAYGATPKQQHNSDQAEG
ncbi:MAG: hypothetical protein KIT47_21720, partial [Rhodoferax sp.]|nr:hypothetical protein [Rhodoferax sp.]